MDQHDNLLNGVRASAHQVIQAGQTLVRLITKVEKGHGAGMGKKGVRAITADASASGCLERIESNLADIAKLKESVVQISGDLPGIIESLAASFSETKTGEGDIGGGGGGAPAMGKATSFDEAAGPPIIRTKSVSGFGHLVSHTATSGRKDTTTKHGAMLKFEQKKAILNSLGDHASHTVVRSRSSSMAIPGTPGEILGSPVVTKQRAQSMVSGYNMSVESSIGNWKHSTGMHHPASGTAGKGGKGRDGGEVGELSEDEQRVRHVKDILSDVAKAIKGVGTMISNLNASLDCIATDLEGICTFVDKIAAILMPLAGSKQDSGGGAGGFNTPSKSGAGASDTGDGGGDAAGGDEPSEGALGFMKKTAQERQESPGGPKRRDSTALMSVSLRRESSLSPKKPVGLLSDTLGTPKVYW